MKKIAIIQARMGSTRFPGKVLETLYDKPVLQWVVDAARKIATIDDVVVATSTSQSDASIVEWCRQKNVSCFQGSESDVLERFYEAAQKYNANYIVRLTADCPLLSAEIASQVLHLVAAGHAEYASNVAPPTWPDGLDCEAFSFKALQQAHQKATRRSDREHVTPFIHNNQNTFKSRNVTSPIPGIHKHRWTIDTKDDLDYVNAILDKTQGDASLCTILQLLEKDKTLIQPDYRRNEGFEKSLKEENTNVSDFSNSHKMLKRALKTIPLGSQTFSKSYIQYPENTSPMFLTHGQGSHVWDVDGNEYIDMVSALLPNVLGYADPDVNDAIQTQLQKGISFSLSTDLEMQLAEKLCSIIPSAEKVRFAKNGTDVTSAAVRLARAYTDRDKVILCGYHGWQDWSIGTTTRNKGVPKAVSDLSVSVPYNDLNHVEDLLKTESYACVIIEPCNTTAPVSGYLQGIKDLCEKYGSLFIFDEVITGFRFAIGGAQEYFGVTPHLSCFGKAMGNGMPISAIVGQNHIMKEMEEIFFSGTFGGETLSLAAALATIAKIEKCGVVKHLWSYGQNLGTYIEQLIVKYDLEKFLNLCGYAPWKIIQFLYHPNATSFELKTLFIQEMISRGILVNSSLNINFSHADQDQYKILKAFEEVLSIISDSLKKQQIITLLKSHSIKPLFKVR